MTKILSRVVIGGPLQDQLLRIHPLYHRHPRGNTNFGPYAHPSATFPVIRNELKYSSL
jgi:hypothetical protein